MKTFVGLSLLLCLAFTGNAQDTRKLKKTESSFEKNIFLPTSTPQEYSYAIRESYAGEFEADPIRFLKENFDIQALLELEKRNHNGAYKITLRNTKGFLEATYSRKGELVKTFQKFD